jgi:hypothetical protein
MEDMTMAENEVKVQETQASQIIDEAADLVGAIKPEYADEAEQIADAVTDVIEQADDLPATQSRWKSPILWAGIAGVAVLVIRVFTGQDYSNLAQEVLAVGGGVLAVLAAINNPKDRKKI